MSEATPTGRRPHRGVMILVLGILGIVMSCLPLGIVAWVMGNNDLKAMERGEIDPDGRGMTQAGKILGIISVVVGCIGIVFFFMFVGFAGCAAALGSR